MSTSTVEQALASTTDAEPTIDQDIRGRVEQIMTSMNESLKERREVIHGSWVGRVAGLHLVMRGPGGTGKSLLQRTMTEHISDAIRFEVALDETTDPSQVFGPPDIKAMAEDGVVRRITTGMLPEATDGFLDEFFNGNIPLLHSIMPIMNERLFHNAGMPIMTPVRQVMMGTNKLNLDPDLAALFDRVHLRFDVDYVKDRDMLADMLARSITRLAEKGRGAATDIGQNKTTVTVDELDSAFAEALRLDVSDSVLTMFIDIREELKSNGINFSDRRFNDGFLAVLSNAWIRNHVSVQAGDLDILANMWWTTEDQISKSKEIVLSAAAPGRMRVIELLDSLDQFKKEVRDSEGMDEEKARRVCVEAVRNAETLQQTAEAERKVAEDAKLPTGDLDDLIKATVAFKKSVAKQMFGLTDADLASTS